MRTGDKARQQGFTYLALLIAIAVMGIGLTALSEVWSTVAQRQRLQQLEWVGNQYMNAISSYYYSGPHGQFTYPNSLHVLLDDTRFTPPKRHLRQSYKTALSNDLSWKPVFHGDALIGVKVSSEDGSMAERFFIKRPMVEH